MRANSTTLVPVYDFCFCRRSQRVFFSRLRCLCLAIFLRRHFFSSLDK